MKEMMVFTNEYGSHVGKRVCVRRRELIAKACTADDDDNKRKYQRDLKMSGFQIIRPESLLGLGD
jgi:hypothetical protein